jgi:predicted metal-dependent phosphoesterase TrpH
VRGIPGVEISIEHSGGTLHMLGYFMDHHNARILQALARLRRGREERNQFILERLSALGMPLAWEDVASLAKEDVVGRPHFAQAMITKGYVKKKDEAFDHYLGKGKPAYVERDRFTVEESIELIRGAGGVPILAHPYTLNMGRRRLREFLAELNTKGLQGIEAYYSEHSHEQHRFCINMARDLGWVVTGGSDFHGAMNPHIRLGLGFGSLDIPDELVELLHARCPQN